MPGVAARLLTLLLLALWVPSPAAGDPPPADAPPAREEAAEAPAVAGEADAADEAEKAMVDAARGQFVIVRVWYRKDPQMAAQLQSDYRLRRLFSEYFDQKKPEEHAAVLLPDGTSLLMVDDGIDDRLIDRIETTGPDGKTVPLRRKALLRQAPLIMLGSPVNLADGRTMPPLADDRQATPARTALLTKEEGQMFVRLTALSTMHPFGRDGSTLYGSGLLGEGSRYGFGSLVVTPKLVGDSRGRIIGITAMPILADDDEYGIWRMADVLKGARLEWAEVARRREAVQNALRKSAHEVIVRLRGDGDEGPVRYEESGSGHELSVFGVAISDRWILVPLTLDREAATRIEGMELRLPDGRRMPLRFVGAYRDFGAFVVEQPEGGLSPVALAGEDLKRVEPFLTAVPETVLGRTDARLSANRLMGRDEGFKQQLEWSGQFPIEDGALLMTLDGRLAGLSVQPRSEDDEQRRLEQDRSRYDRDEPRLFLIGQIREALRNPRGHLDERVAIRPPQVARRRPWLGVEFVGMTEQLARVLKVESPTRDGEVGFIVNAVYPGSPAEKLGLKVGDILLSVTVPGRRQPLDLRGELVEDDDFGYPYWRIGAGGDEAMPAEVMWKSRANVLTRLLDAVGEGKTIGLTIHRPDGEGKGTFSRQVAIEMAPPDQQSAPKWRNRPLGLTVRDLTYEVRYGLDLSAEAPGVLVAQVEEGSAVALARVTINEVITHVDGKPLRSAAAMQQTIAAAAAAGRQKVRLTVLRLGRTRFADLEIESYDRGDDEGLAPAGPVAEPPRQ